MNGDPCESEGAVPWSKQREVRPRHAQIGLSRGNTWAYTPDKSAPRLPCQPVLKGVVTGPRSVVIVLMRDQSADTVKGGMLWCRASIPKEAVSSGQG